MLFTTAKAQPISRYNTFSYNVNEGLLQSTLGYLAIDKNNFCWISFPNGIQQFDGNDFRTVGIQPGLPDNKSVKLFRCNNGDLLLSHSEGISRYDINTNGFTHVYKQHPALKKRVFFIGEDNGVVYFYDETATIVGLDNRTLAVVSSTKTGLPPYSTLSENSPEFSDQIVDHKVAFWVTNTICIWDLQEKKLVRRSPFMTGVSTFSIFLTANNKVLYTSHNDNNSFQCWDFNTGKHETRPIGSEDKTLDLSRFRIFRWQGRHFMTLGNRMFETDSTFTVLISELVNFQNQPVSSNHAISAIIEDHFGNLYLQTITGGIKKIIRNNYPVKYYGSLKKEENAVIGVLPDKKNNRILVGTSVSGLLIFDTLQQLLKHIPVIPIKGERNLGINAMIRNGKGDYILFPRGSKNVLTLSKDLSSLSSHPIAYADTPEHVINYFGSIIYQDDKTALVQSMYQVFRTYLSTNQTTAYRISGEYILSRLWYDNMVISHVFDELIYHDGQTFKEIKRIHFPNTGGVRCMEKDEKGNILLGTNKGVFRIDITGKVLDHWSKESGLPDDCIYAIATDKNGNLWCSSNKGIIRIDKNNNILQLTREDGLQENEFNTGVVATADDGELFFGGMNGVSSFFPSAINSFDERLKVLITRIRVNNDDLKNDSAIWNVDKLKLRYDQNSLSFDFVAIANSNPAQYTYQYRMIGIDKEWLQTSGLQTIRYSLPPGKYTLQIYASRSFDRNARPMKEIRIIIRPPFWKSLWFRIGLSALLVGILTYTINQANKRKYAKHLMQLEHEQKIKQERERISKDLHDSLGAYANAVLYNADLLEKEMTNQRRVELIGGLKFASKDIITSLRETVWALKKESYTAEDCLVRIRNFIQPFTRYYEHISFRVNGEAPAGRVLHYTEALNLVRIVQEAISNSLKHARPSLIQVTSLYFNDRWQLVITDDGQGFDKEAARKAEQGNGLYNMEHRAAAAGFDLKLETTTGAGTTITIIV